MRILTVRQPWSEAIIFGQKDVENRSRNIAGDYRGPVAIHTAKYVPTPAEWLTFDRAHPKAMMRMCEKVPWAQEEFGVIIGVVDLIDVHRAEGNDAGIVADMIRDQNPYSLNGSCSPWAEANAYHLVLANPRPLAEPIPYKGALGLRHLDDDMTARILAQIEQPHDHLRPKPRRTRRSPRHLPR